MQLGPATFEPFESLLGPGVCGKLQCLLPRRAIPTFHREAPESGAGCCEDHSHHLFGSLCPQRAFACCSPTRGTDRRRPWAPCHRCRRTSRLGLLSSIQRSPWVPSSCCEPTGVSSGERAFQIQYSLAAWVQAALNRAPVGGMHVQAHAYLEFSSN